MNAGYAVGDRVRIDFDSVCMGKFIEHVSALGTVNRVGVQDWEPGSPLFWDVTTDNGGNERVWRPEHICPLEPAYDGMLW